MFKNWTGNQWYGAVLHLHTEQIGFWVQNLLLCLVYPGSTLQFVGNHCASYEQETTSCRTLYSELYELRNWSL